jgi:hypothetical protein
MTLVKREINANFKGESNMADLPEYQKQQAPGAQSKDKNFKGSEIEKNNLSGKNTDNKVGSNGSTQKPE